MAEIDVSNFGLLLNTIGYSHYNNASEIRGSYFSNLHTEEKSDLSIRTSESVSFFDDFYTSYSHTGHFYSSTSGRTYTDEGSGNYSAPIFEYGLNVHNNWLSLLSSLESFDYGGSRYGGSSILSNGMATQSATYRSTGGQIVLNHSPNREQGHATVLWSLGTGTFKVTDSYYGSYTEHIIALYPNAENNVTTHGDSKTSSTSYSEYSELHYIFPEMSENCYYKLGTFYQTLYHTTVSK